MRETKSKELAEQIVPEYEGRVICTVDGDRHRLPILPDVLEPQWYIVCSVPSEIPDEFITEIFEYYETNSRMEF